jgi:hypothetical protein
MYASIPGTGLGFFAGVCTSSYATAIFRDPPHHRHKDRSPIGRTPARRGSRTALPWAVPSPGVEVNHYPPAARAPLTNHPRTALHVVHGPLKASQAGALLIGTCSFGVIVAAKSSSTSWS